MGSRRIGASWHLRTYRYNGTSAPGFPVKRYYEILAPAADALEEKHPLAATVLRRAMIDFTLTATRAKRYRHAARHLAECARLAERIEDFGSLEPHEAYLARLRAEHGRKSAFWSLVD